MGYILWLSTGIRKKSVEPAKCWNVDVSSRSQDSGILTEFSAPPWQCRQHSVGFLCILRKTECFGGKLFFCLVALNFTSSVLFQFFLYNLSLIQSSLFWQSCPSPSFSQSNYPLLPSSRLSSSGFSLLHKSPYQTTSSVTPLDSRLQSRSFPSPSMSFPARASSFLFWILIKLKRLFLDPYPSFFAKLLLVLASHFNNRKNIFYM